MIETFKDIKHGKSGSQYESAHLERTASQILHHMEGKIEGSEDSLESTRARVLANAKAIYGSTRNLDIISFAPTSSRKIGAAIVEHQPTGRSYVHCSSAKEDSRLAAVEHLLIITEDILARLIDNEGITSSGWLPATAQAQHAATFNAASLASSSTSGSVPTSVVPSVAGSVPASRRSSVQPLDTYTTNEPPSPHHHHHNHNHHPHQALTALQQQQQALPQQPSANSTPINPLALQVFQQAQHHQQAQHQQQQQGQKQPALLRNNSVDSMAQIPNMAVIPRTNSDFLAQPRPVPVGQYQGLQSNVAGGGGGHNRHGGRVQWNLGSE